MTVLIEILLQGRDYWVLVEQQFMDADARAGLYFNIQLQMSIEMYYLQKGRAVKTKRYPFLGIHTRKTGTRAARKKKSSRWSAGCWTHQSFNTTPLQPGSTTQQTGTMP
jgi:hypothetical protein